MDSGNHSGSFQSSSGGDDEYDSRATESFSPFMTNHINHPTTHVGPISSNPPPPAMFDQIENSFFQQQNQNPSIIYNNPNMMIWSTPDPNTNQLPSFRPLVPADNTNSGAATPDTSARNPKKRSRASRRAPTTVLTTDTTNFRAMVQEFTGIPSPPFNSSPFSVRTAPYLRRPFPQKVQTPTSSFLASATSNTAAAASNYQLLPNITQNSNVLNNQNSILNSTMGSNPQNSFDIPSNYHSRFKMGGFDEFGLGGQGLMAPNQIATRGADNSDSSSSFRGENGPENVTTRSEGMIESWICSSD